jgi:hypothetical protein
MLVRRCLVSIYSRNLDQARVIRKTGLHKNPQFSKTADDVSCLSPRDEGRAGGIVSKRWRSWLRHYATNRNVAGSIPDGVIGIFH